MWLTCMKEGRHCLTSIWLSDQGPKCCLYAVNTAVYTQIESLSWFSGLERFEGQKRTTGERDELEQASKVPLFSWKIEISAIWSHFNFSQAADAILEYHEGAVGSVRFNIFIFSYHTFVFWHSLVSTVTIYQCCVRTDENKPFAIDRQKPEGAGFYSEDLSYKEFKVKHLAVFFSQTNATERKKWIKK